MEKNLTITSSRPMQRLNFKVSASYSSLVFWSPPHLLQALVVARPEWSCGSWQDSTWMSRAKYITRRVCVEGGMGRERYWAPLFPWDYVSLDLGWTRCFFKLTNELPNFHRLSDGSTSWLDLQVSLVKHLPLCPLTIRLGPGERKGGVLIPWQCKAVIPWSMKL